MPTAFLLAGALLTAGPLALTIGMPAPARALLAPAPAAGGTPGSPADACADLGAIPESPACGDLPLCSPRQRAKIACELRDALESRYVFFDVKGRLLSGEGTGFDSRRHLDACVAAERVIGREADPLRFYDRMRRCTAAFEDGHLLLGVPAGLPEVSLGVGLRLAEGRVFVASRERKLLDRLEADGAVPGAGALVTPGTEVLAIDGRPVGEALSELAGMVPGSSTAARLERAVDALTRRDFAFPEKRTAALTLVVDGTPRVVELPWWISPDAAKHPAARDYVRRSGIPTTSLVTWRGGGGADAAADGALRGDPILPARDAALLREYRDEAGKVAVRAGEVVRRRDRAFCYLQILTFHTETLDGGDGRRPFPAVLDRFVRACGEKDLDLVLDLRQNAGGYISHTSALAAALSLPGRTVPAGALLLRASERTEAVYRERAPAGAPPRAGDPLDPARIAEAIREAAREKRGVTPAFLESPIHADPSAGYGGRVVALVSPGCMSACDRLAGMLRESGRAVLVGTPTEGAGGSQQEAKDLGARWSDGAGLLSLSIPNAAMGVQQSVPAAGAAEASADEFFRALALENRPVAPDVVYATRRDDLVGENRGWLERAEAVLFGSPDGGAAGR